MQDPWNKIEYGRVELPDGLLLLIERERAPRLGRPGQIALEIGLATAILLLPWFLDPITSLIFFAGLWSAIPGLLAYVAVTLVIWAKANNWAASPPNDPELCRVVGMDLASEELVRIMRGQQFRDIVSWSVH